MFSKIIVKNISLSAIISISSSLLPIIKLLDSFNIIKLDDFLEQIKKIKQMGNLKDMVNMIPGASKAMGDNEVDEDSFKHIEALIYSMTPKERSNPKIIDVSRKKRISKGSGLDVHELNKLLKQFEQMSKMMKMVQSGGAGKLMQMMNNLKN